MKWWTFGDMKNGLGIYECHGQLERFRNGSSRAFTPQSQPDPFRNRSTAITSRGGRLVPERPDAVEQVWTRAPGCVPEPFRSQSCGVNTALGRVHTCSGREPDSSVPGARVRFASTRAKNRPAANRSRPVKLKPRVHTATGTVPGLAWLHVVNLWVTGWGRHVISINHLIQPWTMTWLDGGSCYCY